MAYHARSVRDDIHYETLPPKTKQQQNRPPWGYFLLGMALDAPPTAIDHTKKASHGRNVNLDLSLALLSLPLSVAAVYGHRAAYCWGGAFAKFRATPKHSCRFQPRFRSINRLFVIVDHFPAETGHSPTVGKTASITLPSLAQTAGAFRFGPLSE